VYVVALQEERKVVYVGRIPHDFTKYDLRRKMECFGDIVNVSVHMRDYGSVFFVSIRLDLACLNRKFHVGIFYIIRCRLLLIPFQ